MLTLVQRLQRIQATSDLDQQLRLATVFTERVQNAIDQNGTLPGQQFSLEKELRTAKQIEVTLKDHYFELHDAILSGNPLAPICMMGAAAPSLLRKGQRVLVDWQGLEEPLLATFIETSIALDNESFERVMVTMDNGVECVYPGFHPDCVKPLVKRVQI